MFNVLLLDDDSDFLKALQSYLVREGYGVETATNADDAYEIMYRTVFDLIISDIMMPGTDGFQFAEQVRSINANVPLLFISARDDIGAKHKGFSIGIDDYMVKPIDFEELSMRIRALLRRAGISSSRRIEIGKTVLDSDEHAAYVDGEQVPLTLREFNILFKMLSYPRKTFSRQQLMDEFWDIDSTSGTRTVDVYMTKIRDKFSSCSDFEIQTVHGLGYKAVIK
ncbi:MAG: response regulator transcription factor [Sphaerochaetaceae bacterium]|nr:response regulator transcription factor [Sphaerochaetaceae bacterium]